MAAASERVCPLPQTRTIVSISQIPHIAQAQEHAKRAKEVVVEVKDNSNRLTLTLNWAGRVCRSPAASLRLIMSRSTAMSHFRVAARTSGRLSSRISPTGTRSPLRGHPCPCTPRSRLQRSSSSAIDLERLSVLPSAHLGR